MRRTPVTLTFHTWGTDADDTWVARDALNSLPDYLMLELGRYKGAWL